MICVTRQWQKAEKMFNCYVMALEIKKCTNSYASNRGFSSEFDVYRTEET